MKLLFCVLLMGVYLSLSAQVEISLDQQRISMYIPQYDIIEVVDARNNGELIGSVHKALRGKTELAYFEQPFEEAILGMFENSNDDSSLRPLILQFNAFKIYDFDYYRNRYTYVELNIDFITEIDGQYYSLFESAVVQNQQSLNIGIGGNGEIGISASSHPLNIRAAIKKSLAAFIMRLENNELDRNPIEIGVPKEIFYPIELAAASPRGLFVSFDDFRDNIVTEVALESSLLESDLGIAYDQAKLKIIGRGMPSKKDIWGFSDGENCFMRIGTKFHRISRKQDTLLVKFLPPKEKSSLDNLLSLTSGITAVLIADVERAGMDSKYGKSTQIKGAQDGWQIDMLTGNVMPNNPDVRAKVVFYNSKFNSKSTEVTVKIGGAKICTLPTNTAFIYQSEQDVKEAQICFIINGESRCESILPDFSSTQVYKIKYHKRKGVQMEMIVSSARADVIKAIKSEDMEVVLRYKE
ncbi:MAG: hypothetical protein AAF847_07375 [Bacteroidota bacterium]